MPLNVPWLFQRLIWATIWAPNPEKSISPSYLWEGWLLCPSQNHLRPFSLSDRGERSTYSRNAASLQNWIQLPRPVTGQCALWLEGKQDKRVILLSSFPLQGKVSLIELVHFHITCGTLLSERIRIYLMRQGFDKMHCQGKKSQG